jgi:hypothetical protein
MTQVLFFGGYRASLQDVTMWAHSVTTKRPNVEVRPYPWPNGASAADPMEKWPEGKSAEIAQRIRKAPDQLHVIVGHSSGCAIANDVAAAALHVGAGNFRLVSLDGFTPGSTLMALPGTVRWSASGPHGEHSRNYLPEAPPHYRVYHAKVGEPWPLHFSLVNLGASDEFDELAQGYHDVDANLEVLGLGDASLIA